MQRRLIATLAVLAVFLTPIGALWCAYTCAVDDDATPAVASAGGLSTSAPSEAIASQVVFRAPDECAADLTNTAILAVVQARVRHAGSLVVLPVAGPLPSAIAPVCAAHPIRWALSSGSPPGVRSSSVLRI